MNDNRMFDAAFAVAGDGAKPWLVCRGCGRLQLVLDPEDRADIADNPWRCARCNSDLYEWTAQPCAWCLSEQRFIGPTPANTSHGICPRHYEMMMDLEGKL